MLKFIKNDNKKVMLLVETVVVIEEIEGIINAETRITCSVDGHLLVYDVKETIEEVSSALATEVFLKVPK